MKPRFSKWRSFIWPVHRHELKKVLPMLGMFFLIAFNYTVLRNAKDTLLVTAPGSGAEVIPFIKLWVVLPMAILFMLIYAELSNKLSRKALFYASLTPFLIFFALFGFIIYPLRDIVHPHESADFLETILPLGLKGLVAIYRNWTFAFFYAISELWGSVMLSLVFWGFANQTTQVSEAKRFYNLFGLGGNTAPIFAGIFTVHISGLDKAVSVADAYTAPIRLLCLTVVGIGLLIALGYWWINRYVLTDPLLYDQRLAPPTEDKLKMSLKDSFLFLAKSKYIGCLALLVIAYGVSINLIEVNWKNQVRLQYTNPNDYASFMGYFSTWTGIASFFMVFFVGGNVIRRFGWITAAMITPIVLLITSIAFFSFILFQDGLGPYVAVFGLSPLMLAVIFGSIQNIISKSAKYSLFDPTKEMAYIPLDDESKVKGKAAIEVVGSRFGKSGGAFIQQGLLLLLGTIDAIAPFVAIIMIAVIGCWMLAARSLGRQFAKRTREEVYEH